MVRFCFYVISVALVVSSVSRGNEILWWNNVSEPPKNVSVAVPTSIVMEYTDQWPKGFKTQKFQGALAGLVNQSFQWLYESRPEGNSLFRWNSDQGALQRKQISILLTTTSVQLPAEAFGLHAIFPNCRQAAKSGRPITVWMPNSTAELVLLSPRPIFVPIFLDKIFDVNKTGNIKDIKKDTAAFVYLLAYAIFSELQVHLEHKAGQASYNFHSVAYARRAYTAFSDFVIRSLATEWWRELESDQKKFLLATSNAYQDELKKLESLSEEQTCQVELGGVLKTGPWIDGFHGAN